MDDHMKRRLDELAARTNRTKSCIAREAVAAFLAEQEMLLSPPAPAAARL